MTFKHTKFEDSVTMRSLEKIAKEKGMFKDEPLNKTASITKKANLNPSTNFMKNILNLCAGLRESGFNKYAEELETKFVSYKQAQTLYEISDEEGKDLIDAAHPDGSAKLEDVDGDAVVETILDQHMKDLEVVNKKPTGKLANAFNIINAVKIVLAQDTAPGFTNDDEKEAVRQQWIKTRLNEAVAFLQKAQKENGNKITVKQKQDLFNKTSEGAIYLIKDALSDSNVTQMELNKISGALNYLKDSFKLNLTPDWYDAAGLLMPGILALKKTYEIGRDVVNKVEQDTGESARENQVLSPVFQAIEKVDTAKGFFSGKYDTFISNEINSKLELDKKTAFQVEKNKDVAALTDWMTKVPTFNKMPQQKKDEALNWMKDQIEEIKGINNQEQLNVIRQENAQGYNAYVKPYLAK